MIATLERRRRDAHLQLKTANKLFTEARAQAVTGDDHARFAADEALRQARAARAELVSLDELEGVVRGRVRR